MNMISDIDIRDAFFDEIFAQAEKDKNLIFLCADMGAFSLDRFKAELPQQFINMGVAEQNMISVAAGLALSGKNVFVYSIAPFVTMRVFEQIKIDLCCMNLPVTIVGMGAGLTYSTDGPTHHAIHDLALMRSLPEMTIFHPCDASSAAAIAKISYESKHPVYVRLEKGQLPDIYDPDKKDFSCGFGLLTAGGDASIVAMGVMTDIACRVAAQLKEEGLNIQVIDVYRLKPLNFLVLKKALMKTPCILTFEEHTHTGGLGSDLVSWLAADCDTTPVKRCAIPDQHVFESASREELHQLFGLTAEQLKETVKNWIEQNKK
ncbi:transketolase family protein [Candidatus Omnitrophota bacterium]